MFDKDSMLHPRRTDLCPEQMDFANADPSLTLVEALKRDDLFLGISGPSLLPAVLVGAMVLKPIIFALANPAREIMPDAARAESPGAMIATGRSGFPNKVNNVLCFPFIFRGALGLAASDIKDEMKLACADAIASLARATTSAEVSAGYQVKRLTFGAEYLISKLFDPRLPNNRTGGCQSSDELWNGEKGN